MGIDEEEESIEEVPYVLRYMKAFQAKYLLNKKKYIRVFKNRAEAVSTANSLNAIHGEGTYVPIPWQEFKDTR